MTDGHGNWALNGQVPAQNGWRLTRIAKAILEVEGKAPDSRTEVRFFGM